MNALAQFYCLTTRLRLVLTPLRLSYLRLRIDTKFESESELDN